MLVLAVDTATPDLLVGVVEAPSLEVRAQTVVRATRGHNEILVPTTQEVLATAGVSFAELDAIVVGCGPGPFTGLRVGMVTAAAFGQALGIPVHGITTHDALAWSLPGTTLVATDARRREIYWARYENSQRTHGPAVTAPAHLDAPLADHLVIPEHLAGALPAEWQGVAHSVPAPDARAFVALAPLDDPNPAPLQALYLRRPDAIPPADVPLSPAIPQVNVDEL